MSKAVFFLIVWKLLHNLVPRHGEIETVDLKDTAWAITNTTNNPSKAIALMVQTSFEAHLSKRIQEGNCHSDECDPLVQRDREGRKTIVFRARGIWQVQDDRDGELWEHALGNTRLALLAGAQLASRRLDVRCASRAEQYGAQTGKGCLDSELGRKRAALHDDLQNLWYAAARIGWSAEDLAMAEHELSYPVLPTASTDAKTTVTVKAVDNRQRP